MSDDPRIQQASVDVVNLGEFVPADERERLEVTPCYGHDVLAAAKRGWRNKSRAALKEAAECMEKSGWDGKEWLVFTGTLHALVSVMGERGLTEEEARKVMQRLLDRTAFDGRTDLAILLERRT